MLFVCGESSAQRNVTMIDTDRRDRQVPERSAAENRTNDAREGIIRDPVRWNGQIVSYVKDVGVGDPDYDANVKKVLLQVPGGGTQAVPETEILRNVAPRESDSFQADRDPTKTFPKGHPADVGGTSTREDTIADHQDRA